MTRPHLPVHTPHSSGPGLLLRRDIALPGSPGRGRRPGYHLDRRLPWWAALLVAALALLVFSLVHLATPHQLADTHLAGTRTLSGRACIVVAADLSGSMADLTPQRRTAVDALLPWLRTNLNPDDVVVLVDFTDQATLTLPATPANQLPTSAPAEPALPGRSTLITPALTLAAHTLTDHGCAATELLAISDGELADPPDQLHTTLSAARITHVTVLNPNGDTRPYPLDQPQLASITVTSLGHTPDQISLTIARTIAHLTGQHLHKT